jgi:hypothetical protein
VQSTRGLKSSAPRAGYATYLSPGGCGLVPPDIPGKRLTDRDGGAVITVLSEQDGFPTVDEVIEFDGTLRAAGALAPLPKPMDRPRW